MIGFIPVYGCTFPIGHRDLPAEKPTHPPAGKKLVDGIREQFRHLLERSRDGASASPQQHPQQQQPAVAGVSVSAAGSGAAAGDYPGGLEEEEEETLGAGRPVGGTLSLAKDGLKARRQRGGSYARNAVLSVHHLSCNKNLQY